MHTRGVIYVHCSPLAVCQHVEWAIARAVSASSDTASGTNAATTAFPAITWSVQTVEPSSRRAECGWSGRPGTAAQIAQELRQWPMIRFEVTEEPSPGADGERFMHVPGRGLFRATTGAAGDIQLGEDRLRALMAAAPNSEALAYAIDAALGTAWDADLEPYRYAAEDAALLATA